MSRVAVALLLPLAVPSLPLTAEAQPAGKVYRIGVLRPGQPAKGHIEAFQEGLRERGYVDGQNVVIEFRFAEERFDQLPRVVEELVRLRVDLIPGFHPARGPGGPESDHDGADRLCGRVRSGGDWT